MRSEIFWLLQELADMPSGDEWLAPGERLRQQQIASQQRLSDWRLGRWTAKRALQLALVGGRIPTGLASLELREAPDGRPLPLAAAVPLPVSLSLSHRAGVALCALTDQATDLGCDLELLESRSAAFLEEALTASERRRLATHRLQPELWANAIWSAKESVFKAGLAQHHADPLAFEVEFATPPSAAGWECFTIRRRGTGLPRRGWWRRHDLLILTVVSASLDGPPVAFGRST